MSDTPLPVTEADLDRFVRVWSGAGTRPMRDAIREALAADRAHVAERTRAETLARIDRAAHLAAETIERARAVEPPPDAPSFATNDPRCNRSHPGGQP
jgi:hypothetical protein